MANLAFTIGSKISACFLHDSFEIASASNMTMHHYIQLFSMQRPRNFPQNLVGIALNNSKSRMGEKCMDLELSNLQKAQLKCLEQTEIRKLNP